MPPFITTSHSRLSPVNWCCEYARPVVALPEAMGAVLTRKGYRPDRMESALPSPSEASGRVGGLGQCEPEYEKVSQVAGMRCKIAFTLTLEPARLPALASDPWDFGR